MIKLARLLLITAIAGTFLAGCNDNAPDLASPVLLPSAKTSMIGMTKEAVMAKLGKPTLSQDYKLNNIMVTYLEWKSKDGTTAMQLHGDKVAFEQILPKDKAVQTKPAQ